MFRSPYKGGEYLPVLLGKKSRNGSDYPSLFLCLLKLSLCLFSLKLGIGVAISPSPKEERKNGGGHLSIPFRKSSKNGGGQPSLFLFRLRVISLYFPLG